MLRSAARLLLSALAVALVLAAPAAATTPPLTTTPCPMPGFIPLVAGQPNWVPVAYFCPPDAFRDPSYWDLTVDFGDGTSAKAPYTHGYTGAPHTYAQPGEYTVTAVLRDLREGQVHTFTARRTVAPAPVPPAPPAPPAIDPPCPAVALGAPPVAGVPGTVAVAQHCPPAADRNPANFAVRIDYGDGTSGAGALDSIGWVAHGKHRYAKRGTYTVTAVVRDVRTGVETTYSRRIAVRASFPKGTPGKPRFTVGRKGAPQRLATFTHSQPSMARPFAARIAWGDGRRSRGTVREVKPGTYEVLGAHRYRTMRNRRIVVTVTDARGAELVLRTTALVGRVYDVKPG